MLLRKKRPITPKLMQFRRREDMVKLRRLASAMLQRKPVDKFYLLHEEQSDRYAVNTTVDRLATSVQANRKERTVER
jgi:hypothetical protein